MNEKRRRKDKDHDIGDSMPGTTGHSEGTYHDRVGGGQTYNPEAEELMSEEEVARFLGKGQTKKETKEKSKQKE